MWLAQPTSQVPSGPVNNVLGISRTLEPRILANGERRTRGLYSGQWSRMQPFLGHAWTIPRHNPTISPTSATCPAPVTTSPDHSPSSAGVALVRLARLYRAGTTCHSSINAATPTGRVPLPPIACQFGSQRGVVISVGMTSYSMPWGARSPQGHSRVPVRSQKDMSCGEASRQRMQLKG